MSVCERVNTNDVGWVKNKKSKGNEVTDGWVDFSSVEALGDNSLVVSKSLILIALINTINNEIYSHREK